MTVDSLGVSILLSHFDYSRHGTIVAKDVLAERVARYEVYTPLIAQKAKPGQFVILRLTEDGERVPLTIVNYDARRGTITLIVQAVGKAPNTWTACPSGNKSWTSSVRLETHRKSNISAGCWWSAAAWAPRWLIRLQKP
jgi:2-polyprenylphenol hydroxylase and related flavodoxin oxidoreductases